MKAPSSWSRIIIQSYSQSISVFEYHLPDLRPPSLLPVNKIRTPGTFDSDVQACWKFLAHFCSASPLSRSAPPGVGRDGRVARSMLSDSVSGNADHAVTPFVPLLADPQQVIPTQGTRRQANTFVSAGHRVGRDRGRFSTGLEGLYV